MNIDWQSLLLASIPGLLALIAVVYSKFQDWKAKRAELDQTNQARREPTWNELVTENRNLRKDLNTLIDDLERVKSNLEGHKLTTSRKFRAFENIIRDVFAQWPMGFEHPVFNSDDLTELRDADIPWKDRIRIT